MTPDLDAWAPWTPREVADRLSGVDVPWCVAAGWALDLFRGGQTRPHDDLEIAIPRDRFPEVADRFPDCDFYAAGDGQVIPYADAPADYHQTWALERSAQVWRLDVFREPADGDTWICRRDPAIRMPYARLIACTDDGVPYLAPEVVLLFKAKAARDKDQADFAAVLPMLDAAQRDWLGWALQIAHPGHQWLSRL